MTYLLFTTLFLASLALAVRPFLARRAIAWPAEAPDARDDVARADGRPHAAGTRRRIPRRRPPERRGEDVPVRSLEGCEQRGRTQRPRLRPLLIGRDAWSACRRGPRAHAATEGSRRALPEGPHRVPRRGLERRGGHVGRLPRGGPVRREGRDGAPAVRGREAEARAVARERSTPSKERREKLVPFSAEGSADITERLR